MMPSLFWSRNPKSCCKLQVLEGEFIFLYNHTPLPFFWIALSFEWIEKKKKWKKKKKICAPSLVSWGRWLYFRVLNQVQWEISSSSPRETNMIQWRITDDTVWMFINVVLEFTVGVLSPRWHVYRIFFFFLIMFINSWSNHSRDGYRLSYDHAKLQGTLTSCLAYV